MLLEKSLVMTGEIIEADSIWVGAPAARLLSYDTSSINTIPVEAPLYDPMQAKQFTNLIQSYSYELTG